MQCTHSTDPLSGRKGWRDHLHDFDPNYPLDSIQLCTDTDNYKLQITKLSDSTHLHLIIGLHTSYSCLISPWQAHLAYYLTNIVTVVKSNMQDEESDHGMQDMDEHHRLWCQYCNWYIFTPPPANIIKCTIIHTIDILLPPLSFSCCCCLHLLHLLHQHLVLHRHCHQAWAPPPSPWLSEKIL